MSAKIVSLFAEKGGVGRTTTSINIAGALAEQGNRVLLVDTDKQASLSKYVFPEEELQDLHPVNTIAGILDPDVDPDPAHAISNTGFEGISLIPANKRMRPFIVPETQWSDDLAFSLCEFLEDVSEEFDFVVIDTPPDIDLLPAWATLLASHYVLTPVEPQKNSALSLPGGNARLVTAMHEANPHLRFLGYFLSRRKRSKLHDKFEQTLRRMHDNQVFETVIKDLVAFAEAEALSKPVIHYDPDSQAANLVRQFTAEMLARIERLASATTSDTLKRGAA